MLAVYIAPWKAAAAVCVVCLLPGIRNDIANVSSFLVGLAEFARSRRRRRRMRVA